ncbi:FAS1-like dehydratase domain-containing protein [Nocardia nova]|uniref:FAS1-like dehydratase domain-containing protein n=1 Tax=Nocardia nova TaxID=37330 RepID=UPI000CEA0FDD|nr:MaoC family dehydratase N-terminal domain-containing protein [Nocardia nova]PPI96624.1 hypothetical protein C5E46_17800 [Nocardia nova]
MHAIAPDQTDENRSPIGLRYRAADRYVVTAQRIRAYSAAVRNRHAAHFSTAAAARSGFSELVAPPTFAAMPWLAAARELLGILPPGIRPRRVLHAEQTIRIGRLLLAGDVLTTDLYIDSLERYPDYRSLGVTMVLRDRDDRVLQTGSAKLFSDRSFDRLEGPAIDVIRRHPRVVEDRADVAEPVGFARWPRPRSGLRTPAPGTRLPPHTVTVRRRELQRYVAVTGTVDGRVARADEPLCIGTAPGLMRLALTAGAVVSWLGDPGMVRTLHAEFSHHCVRPAPGAQRIELLGSVGRMSSDGRSADLDLDAICRGRHLFARAWAAVNLPDIRSAADAGARIHLGTTTEM